MRTARRLKTAPAATPLPSKRQIEDSIRALRLDRHNAFAELDDAVKYEPVGLVQRVVKAMLDIQKLSREIGLMEGLLMRPGSYRSAIRRRSKP